jgi:DNA-binding cell septation regulator SpoVG
MNQAPETKVTEVRLTLIRETAGLIAMAKVVLNDSLVLDSIGVHLKLSGGYRITYPMKNGRYVFHPISKPLGQCIEQAIYNEMGKQLKAVNDDRYYCADPSGRSIQGQ